MGLLTRSAYLNRVRRAFLLRVHPDRFRNHQSASLLQQQAQLVQALSNRMSQVDFQEWQNNVTVSAASINRPYRKETDNRRNYDSRDCYPFALEQRDGSLFQGELRLNRSVDEILADITNALEKCGAGATLPTAKDFLTMVEQPKYNPNTTASATGSSRGNASDHNLAHDSPWTFSSPRNIPLSEREYQRYSIVSNLGRNLLHFVQQGVDHQEIAARKMARTDAQAAALAVRRLYKFQAVDATTLGWSSASVAILLKRLLELHQDHHESFHVDSFYPLRLVFTPFDEVEERLHATMYHQSDEKTTTTFATLDTYGGVLRLHPASTPVQWLQHLQQVTSETLDTVIQRRSEIEQYKGLIHSRYNFKFLKGFSCSSRDYFHVLQRLCSLGIDDNNDLEQQQNLTNQALVPEPVIVTVEADTACGHRQRPTVTYEGTIQISMEMCNDKLLRSLSRLVSEARQRRADYERQKQQCQDVAREIQWHLGLPRAVYQTGVIRQDDFLDSLRRIQRELVGGGGGGFLSSKENSGDENDDDDDDTNKMENLLQTLKMGLSGNALGITGSGHFCHLADDGSVVIPHNWN